MEKDDIEKLKMQWAAFVLRSGTCQRSLPAVDLAAQTRILFELNKEKAPLSPSQIQKILQVGSGRTGNLLKLMEKKGWIKRSTSETDRRKTLVFLTQAGKDAFDRETKGFLEATNKVIDRFGAEELSQFMKEGKRLLAVIDGVKKEGPKPL
jgi:DNA-binding MarR family transcriptional regulator